MAIIHKIKELGGFAYSSEKDGQFEFTKSMIDRVKKTLGILPDKEVIDFVSQYGFGYFIDEVGIIPKELPPQVTKQDPVCPLGRFFGFSDGKNSIENIIKAYGIPGPDIYQVFFIMRRCIRRYNFIFTGRKVLWENLLLVS